MTRGAPPERRIGNLRIRTSESSTCELKYYVLIVLTIGNAGLPFCIYAVQCAASFWETLACDPPVTIWNRLEILPLL